MNIESFLEQDDKKDLLRFLTAGSVDDGKSTLIGKLLFDTKKLYDDQLAALEADSKKMGHAGENIDYALLLDGLKAEREQGITIDVAYRYFATNKRKFIIADTPGHEQYTRNMVTGASTANLAIILVNAQTGVITQTKRHTFLVSLLGIKHVVLAVNKMDLVQYNQNVFNNICENYRQFTNNFNFNTLHYIPMAAVLGENVVNTSNNMPWYNGNTLLNLLETIAITSEHNFSNFRFPVQHVLRPSHDFRGFAGQVASGIVKKGDTVMALPSKKLTTVTNIVTHNGNLDEAYPPMSITLTLKDEIDLSRGEMLVHANNIPNIGKTFTATLVWMHETPMQLNDQFIIKHNTRTTKATISNIQHLINVNTLEHSFANCMQLNEIALVEVATMQPLFYDAYTDNKTTGSFILIDPVTNATSAVGMIKSPVNNTQQTLTNARVICLQGNLEQTETFAQKLEEQLLIQNKAAFAITNNSLKSMFDNSININITQQYVLNLVHSLVTRGIWVILAVDFDCVSAQVALNNLWETYNINDFNPNTLLQTIK